jgi:hypothetical protein
MKVISTQHAQLLHSTVPWLDALFDHWQKRRLRALIVNDPTEPATGRTVDSTKKPELFAMAASPVFLLFRKTCLVDLDDMALPADLQVSIRTD